MPRHHRFHGPRRSGDPVVPLHGRGGFHVSMTPAQLSVPGPEWVAIASIGGADAGLVLAMLSGIPVPTGGGGIEAVERPLKRPLTRYTGTEAPGLILPILLDGLADNESVEGDCRTIERMAGMFVPGDPGPQKLYVHGPSVPHCRGSEYLRHQWLIAEQPDWGDDPEVQRKRTGARIRQQVTLTLLLDTEADELERLKPRQAQPGYRVAVARDGDTYVKIARREPPDGLGNARYAHKLAELNEDRDPHKRLSAGHKVRLPSAHLLAIWKRDLHIRS